MLRRKKRARPSALLLTPRKRREEGVDAGSGNSGSADSKQIPFDKYKLASDAAIHALTQQDATLTNLRNRATGLTGLATVIGSFSSFFGAGTKDHHLPLWFAVGIVIFIGSILTCAFYVLWPKAGWSFGPDPDKILKSEYSDYKLTWASAKGMAKAVKINEKEIWLRSKFYSVSAVLLGLEAAFVVVASLVYR